MARGCRDLCGDYREVADLTVGTVAIGAVREGVVESAVAVEGEPAHVAGEVDLGEAAGAIELDVCGVGLLGEGHGLIGAGVGQVDVEPIDQKVD